MRKFEGTVETFYNTDEQVEQALDDIGIKARDRKQNIRPLYYKTQENGKYVTYPCKLVGKSVTNGYTSQIIEVNGVHVTINTEFWKDMQKSDFGK